MLQLHKTEGQSEYAEFLHAPRKKYTDFGMFSCRIQSLYSFYNLQNVYDGLSPISKMS